jgi:hypothetical protein
VVQNLSMAPVTTSHRRPPFLALAVTAALLLGGCGSSGGDDAAPTTAAGASTTSSTTTTPGSSGTDGSGDDEPTSTTGPAVDDGGAVSLDDLEALMPDPSVIGPDYRSNSDVEEGYDDPGETDQAATDACPEAASLTAEQDDADDVERLFETDDSREVNLRLDPTPVGQPGPDRIDAIVEAINACDPVVLDQDGVGITMTLAAERDDSLGDHGVTMQMQATLTHPSFPAPLELSFRGRAFVVGSVAVTILTSDGIDEDAMAAVPGDYEQAERLAGQMESAVADLVG